jgi:hypothetical protein
MIFLVLEQSRRNRVADDLLRLLSAKSPAENTRCGHLERSVPTRIDGRSAGELVHHPCHIQSGATSP